MITFQNVAEQPEPPTLGAGSFRHTKRHSINQLAAAQAASAANARLVPGDPKQPTRSPSAGQNERRQARHQGSYSLSVPSTPVPRGPSPFNEPAIPSQRPAHQHKRSVSIISGTSPILAQSVQDAANQRGTARPPGHRRSSTMTLPGKPFIITFLYLSMLTVDKTLAAARTNPSVSFLQTFG